MSVSINEMRGKLLSLDQVRKSLKATEPVQRVPVQLGRTEFRLGAWSSNAEYVKDDEPVDARVIIDGEECQLTKAAVLSACSEVGIPAAYALRTPPTLIETHLDYWFDSGLDRDLQLLTVADHGVAFVRGSLQPYSSLTLFNRVVAALGDRLPGAEILADFKFHHDIRKTSIRLIIPETAVPIHGSRVDNDIWSTGVQIDNSLTAKTSTEISGYLFRWWCSNGATDVLHGKRWNRRAQQDVDVYEWAQREVDSVLGGLEPLIASIQESVHIPIGGYVSDVLSDVYSAHNIPVAAQELITEEMVETDDLSLYGLISAVTSAANETEGAWTDKLLRVGVEIAGSAHERCQACHRVRRARQRQAGAV